MNSEDTFETVLGLIIPLNALKENRIHPNKTETGILLNGFQEIALRKTA
jgi:hypothetical protein